MRWFCLRLALYAAAVLGFTACALQPRAMLGSADAQFRLGMRYLVTTPPDYQKAAHWLRRAAIQGDPKAQKQLGRFYALGLGGHPDFVRAYLWLQVAAVLDAEAEYDRELLARVMTKAQLSEAQALAAAYRPGHAPDADREAAVAKAVPRGDQTKPSATSPTRHGAKLKPSNGYFVKLGVFADRENAQRLQARLRAQGAAVTLTKIRRYGRDLISVRVGPYANAAAARQALQRIEQGLHLKGGRIQPAGSTSPAAITNKKPQPPPAKAAG